MVQDYIIICDEYYCEAVNDNNMLLEVNKTLLTSVLNEIPFYPKEDSL